MSSLFAELKRRNVIRAGVAYLAVAWLVLQASDILSNAFELPPATRRAVFILLCLGLVPVLVFSWVYELTSEGLKREDEVAPGERITHVTARKLNQLVIAALVAVVALLLVDKFVLVPRQQAAAASSAATAATDAVPTQARSPPEKPSLAVLPFDSIDNSSEDTYFADGMTDDIITDLSKLSGIFVVSRNSSSTYKNKSVKVQQVAKDLGVRYVLEGSVRRAGDTLRINAQLVDALGGQHLWADRYDGSIKDVFALQDKVIGQIVAALAVKLTQDERSSVELIETQNPQAYDALLAGMGPLSPRHW